MSSTQKLIRVLGVLLIVGMVLFPPWKMSFLDGPERTPRSESVGYHPLWFRLEVEEDESRAEVNQSINVLRLGLQLAVVLILTNVGLIAARQGSATEYGRESLSGSRRSK